MTDAKPTGLIGGVEKRKIEIVDYDPLWPAKFQVHAKVIADALGDAALQIEHIGSLAAGGTTEHAWHLQAGNGVTM